MTEQKDNRELAERFPKVPRNATPTLSWNDINRIQRYGWDEDCYDADFYAKMRVEKNIRRVVSMPMLDPAVGKEVVHGAIPCPMCAGVAIQT